MSAASAPTTKIPISTGSLTPTRTSAARAASPSSPTAWADTKADKKPVASPSRPCASVYDNAFGGDPQETLTAGLRIGAPEYSAFRRWSIPSSTEWEPPVPLSPSSTANLHFAHVGDSRLYLIRAESISRLTRDHSYVGRLVESGIVRSEDAESHPQRHILTAALGSGRDVAPHIPEHPSPLEEGDTLLLCTDGLWGLVGDPDLARVARANPPAEACSETGEHGARARRSRQHHRAGSASFAA